MKSLLNEVLLVIKTPIVDFKHYSPHLNKSKNHMKRLYGRIKSGVNY